ncbi:class I SAM-dependent methyltransferase [Lyngbya confervoides]|uniref:Class I SAM-dependent methyltransferase n=1 Tax=Lyngbya confervoides BDU141951 TaxID=1574623 RepID=A0ABD4T509_9CYAN|nr:class I SAM-dependent methyltransferase [Lyngbya confervoides]MCM1983550.1 class I SAM-dependent methyltransferase [Lyngbya confervoides BDU141951]
MITIGFNLGQMALRIIALALIAWVILGTVGLNVTIADPSTSSLYQQRPASFDGTGKIYMGREIAQVMGYQGADWLNRPSRAAQEHPDQLVRLLKLRPEDTVADIGAGTGYISARLASQVPAGQVLAVDIQPEMLRLLQDQGVNNLIPIQGSEQSPNLPQASVDLALMVDVYHELAFPREMLNALASSLKPGGHLVIAEYKAENPRVLIKPHHKMSQAQIKAELAASGYQWIQTLRGLPQQHLLVFQRQDPFIAVASP